jgi:hypothetical protein
MSLTTRKMSDDHEVWLVELFGGRRTKGSGNQWHNQCDGRMASSRFSYAFAWDGKSTLGKSIGVSREMWTKTCAQAVPERPMLPLRFYDNEKLDVGHDLVVLSAYDAAELIEDANKYRAIKDQGCLNGEHQFYDMNQGLPVSDCMVCGASIYEQPEVDG